MRGRRSTSGTGLGLVALGALWSRVIPRHFCVAEATKILMQLYQSEVRAPQTITYDQAWTPMKRLASVIEQVSEETAMAGDDA